MKWLFLGFFLFCFSTLAEVVCKSPDNVGGDKASEAGYVPKGCLSAAPDDSDKSVNVQSRVGQLADTTETLQPPETTGSGNGGTGIVR